MKSRKVIISNDIAKSLAQIKYNTEVDKREKRNKLLKYELQSKNKMKNATLSTNDVLGVAQSLSSPNVSGKDIVIQSNIIIDNNHTSGKIRKRK